MRLDPVDPVMGTGGLARPGELPRDRAEQDLRDERALAGSGDAGDGHEPAERERDGDRLEVVLARTPHHERAPVAGAACRGDGDRPLASEERAGDGPRRAEDGLERSGGNDLATVLAGPRPDVDDPVGGPDRLLVVLDDDERVAQVAQARERRDELGVVPLVEPDRRLVEDVQHAHEARPDLRGEADPLRLATGERLARAINREVVEPDVDEKAESGRDLLEDHPRDRLLAL